MNAVLYSTIGAVMGDPMKWLNLALALLGSLAAFGSLEKQRVGRTKFCVVMATLLIVLGLAGQWLSLYREEWLQYVDTALYCGVLSLVLASQRVPTWSMERWAVPLAMVFAVIGGGVFLGGILFG